MADPQWRLLVEGLQFPEGPAFAPDGSLWCVEYKGGRLVRLHSGRVESYEVGGAPNGIAIDNSGSLWFCDAGQCAIRRWNDGRIETLCDSVDGEPLYKPNDLCFDDEGNLIFTCPGDSRSEPLGYVCCLRPDREIRKVATGMYFPNGLALREGILIIAETYRHRLWRGRWDSAAGAWIEAQPWTNAGGPIGPDGMAFHSSGELYVAVYGQQCVKVFEPSGTVLAEIQTPGRNPTNVAFDPRGSLGLVLTEAELGCIWRLPAW